MEFNTKTTGTATLSHSTFSAFKTFVHVLKTEALQFVIYVPRSSNHRNALFVHSLLKRDAAVCKLTKLETVNGLFNFQQMNVITQHNGHVGFLQAATGFRNAMKLDIKKNHYKTKEENYNFLMNFISLFVNTGQ